MLGYLRVFLFVLFASGLVFAEEYNCIKYANSESDNIPIPVCREECIGRVPDCKPNCYDKCPEHSKCVEPEICKCDKGYVKNGPDTNMTCNPIVCPLNSQIVNDTTCKCFDGYKGDIVEMNAILQSCEPICEPSCPAHSFCASPNKCECDKGYVKNGPDTNMTCNLLVCPSNSQMVNDTTCICRDGYQKVERNAILQSCEPICEPSCPAHSFCASPNKCECDKGYVKNGPDTNMTCNLIVCPLNSQMVNDTTCICPDGYQKVESLQSCEPICESSCPAHSFCASPKKCECVHGYEIDEMSDDDPTKLKHCKPVCNAECPENSVCVSPDDCKCNPGYSPITNKSGTLASCLEDSFTAFTETHIIIYSFLICSVIFTIVTVIAMIVICVRKENPAEVPDTRSWHTSFASYAEFEMNENINNNSMGKN